MAVKAVRFACEGCGSTLVSSTIENKRIACGKCNAVQKNPLYIPRVKGQVVLSNSENLFVSNVIVSAVGAEQGNITEKKRSSMKKPTLSNRQPNGAKDEELETAQVVYTGAQPSYLPVAQIDLDTFHCQRCGNLVSYPPNGEIQPKTVRCHTCDMAYDNPKYKTFEELQADETQWLIDDEDGEDPKFRSCTNKMAVVGFLLIAAATIIPAGIALSSMDWNNFGATEEEEETDVVFNFGSDLATLFDAIASICFVWFSFLVLMAELFSGVVSRKVWAMSALFANANWLMLILMMRVLEITNEECLEVSKTISDKMDDETQDFSDLTTYEMAIYFASLTYAFIGIKFMFDGVFTVAAITMKNFQYSTLMLRRPLRHYTPGVYTTSWMIFTGIGYLAAFFSYGLALPLVFLVKGVYPYLYPDLQRSQIASHWQVYFPLAVSTFLLILYTFIILGGVLGCSFGAVEGISTQILIMETGILLGMLLLSPFTNRRLAMKLGYIPFVSEEQLEKYEKQRTLERGLSVALIPKGQLDGTLGNPSFRSDDL